MADLLKMQDSIPYRQSFTEWAEFLAASDHMAGIVSFPVEYESILSGHFDTEEDETELNREHLLRHTKVFSYVLKNCMRLPDVYDLLDMARQMSGTAAVLRKRDLDLSPIPAAIPECLRLWCLDISDKPLLTAIDELTHMAPFAQYNTHIIRLVWAWLRLRQHLTLSPLERQAMTWHA